MVKQKENRSSQSCWNPFPYCQIQNFSHSRIIAIPISGSVTVKLCPMKIKFHENKYKCIPSLIGILPQHIDSLLFLGFFQPRIGYDLSQRSKRAPGMRRAINFNLALKQFVNSIAASSTTPNSASLASCSFAGKWAEKIPIDVISSVVDSTHRVSVTQCNCSRLEMSEHYVWLSKNIYSKSVHKR